MPIAKPTVVDNTPLTLKPYIALGLDLNYRPGDKDAYGDCPWCDKEQKLGVLIASGEWRCNVCGEAGNATTFIRRLWEESFDATDTAEYDALAKERNLLYGASLVSWHLSRSILTDHWLIPGFNGKGNMCTLYSYVSNGQRMLLLPTPTLNHHLLGVSTYQSEKSVVYLCEGIWDAVSCWEMLSAIPDSLGNKLIEKSNVLAIPSAMMFNESWCPLFAGKHVNLMCQNDHPKLHPKTGAEIPAASLAGMRRIASIMAGAADSPAAVNYLLWGENGHDTSLKSGYDLRDFLNRQ